MKSLFAAIGLATLSISGAFAQEKLWTWKGKISSGSVTLNAIAMNQDGSGAFVMEEVPGDLQSVSFLLVWMSAGGTVQMSTRISLAIYSRPPGPSWQLAFTGPDRLIADTGSSLRLYEVKNGKASLVKVVNRQNPLVFGSSTFGGWVDHKESTYKVPAVPPVGQPGSPGYFPGSPAAGMISPDSLTAWKF